MATWVVGFGFFWVVAMVMFGGCGDSGKACPWGGQFHVRRIAALFELLLSISCSG